MPAVNVSYRFIFERQMHAGAEELPAKLLNRCRSLEMREIRD